MISHYVHVSDLWTFFAYYLYHSRKLQWVAIFRVQLLLLLVEVKHARVIPVTGCFRVQVVEDLPVRAGQSTVKYFLYEYLKPARQAVKDMVARKIINVLGSAGKA